MNGGGLMTAFDKCTAALGSYKIVRKFEEKLLFGSLCLTDSGRLDFRRYRTESLSLGELFQLPDFTCVIVFSGAGVPPIKCRFKRLLSCLDTALAVSPNMWMIDESRLRVIEFYRGEITVCEL